MSLDNREIHDKGRAPCQKVRCRQEHANVLVQHAAVFAGVRRFVAVGMQEVVRVPLGHHPCFCHPGSVGGRLSTALRLFEGHQVIPVIPQLLSCVGGTILVEEQREVPV